MVVIYPLVWIIAAISIGYWANGRGRSFFLFTVLALASPLLAVIVLHIIGKHKSLRGD